MLTDQKIINLDVQNCMVYCELLIDYDFHSNYRITWQLEAVIVIYIVIVILFWHIHNWIYCACYIYIVYTYMYTYLIMRS